MKAGVLKLGTPLCIPEKEVRIFIFILIYVIEFENWSCGINLNEQK